MHEQEITLESVTEKAVQLCGQRGWVRDWRQGGVHLHLEASEFIEALRGKGDEPPQSEAGDVLFVLFTLLVAHGLSPRGALQDLNAKLDKLLAETP